MVSQIVVVVVESNKKLSQIEQEILIQIESEMLKQIELEYLIQLIKCDPNVYSVCIIELDN